MIPFDFSAADAGVQWDATPGSGSDLLNVTQAAIDLMMPYTAGNFASRQAGPRRGLLVPAMFQDPDAHEKTLITYGGAALAGGLGMFTAGGGITTLTSGTVATISGTFALGLCWTGIGFMVIGAAVLLYVGYRLLTMKRGDTSTPFRKDKPNLTLEQISGWPNLYPPLYPVDPIPSVTSQIYY